MSSGALWPDQANKLFYLYGGEFNNNDKVRNFDKTIWFYDTIKDTWNQTGDGSRATSEPISWPAYGAGTVDDDGRAYYYGGYLNNKTVPGWGANPLMLKSLITFDMNTRAWSNRTIDDVPRAEGSLHYVAAGKKGSLIYFGGVESPAGIRQYVSEYCKFGWFYGLILPRPT